MTNCINCGAILTSNKCEYCGTEYDLDKHNNVNLQGNTINDYTVELVINGEKIKFYIASIDITHNVDVDRDNDGHLYYDGKKKRKLTLIQY